MLSDRDALFAAICANPDEDTPRLMFADWLEEHGDPASRARAEFIRLQCELARLENDGSDSQPLYEFLRDRDYVTEPSADWTKIDDGIHRRIALAMRAEDLFKRHGEEWIPKLPKKYKVEWRLASHIVYREWQSGSFHRGFAHRVRLGTPRLLKELAPRLRAAVPPVTLVADRFNVGSVNELHEAGLLDWLAGLELASDYGDGLRELGHSPLAARVRAVKLRGYGDVGSFDDALADGPHWTGLHTLDTSDRHMLADEAETLFRAKNLRTLRHLHIRGYGNWTADTIRVLAGAGFSELTSLRLQQCGLGDDAAEVLADCPHLSKLRMLDLPENNIAGRGVTALLTSPHLRNVAFLGLEENAGTGLDAKRLAEAKPGALRMLHAHGCRFNTKDVRALARCPRLRTLWYLDLDNNWIGTAAVRELVRGFGKWCPPILWLTYNRIDDRGAELLAKWKAARGLRVLHLKYNGAMTDAGVNALLDSENLVNLDGLGVPDVTDETEARLKARFRYHDIEY